MLRNRSGWLVLLPALALGVASCVAEGGSEDTGPVGEAVNAAVAEDPAIYGTFRSDAVKDRQITLLTLLENGRYHRTVVHGCVARCEAETTEGKFYRAYRGSHAMIVLLPERGMGGDAYQYVLRENDLLALRPIHEKKWMTLERTVSQAWCGSDEDCQLQGLPVGPCASDWTCGAHVCKYSCGGPKDSD